MRIIALFTSGTLNVVDGKLPSQYTSILGKKLNIYELRYHYLFLNSCKTCSQPIKESKKPAVVVVGDYSTSMIKPSSTSKIVGKKVFCKTIPKAKIEDIILAMESTLDRYHTKALILHIGSNNISNESVENTIREMEKMSSEIKILQ